MARKKTITRDQILKAAYEVVATEGFTRFTARNIAAKMKCSTQPIYLEFKNMEDLKSALISQIFDYLATEVFPIERRGDIIVDLTLNYIGFANKEKRLYRALYLEEYGGGDSMQQFSFDLFVKSVKKDAKYSELSTVELQSLHTGVWIVATGLAALMSSGIIHPTEDQIAKLMTETVDNILIRETPIDITYH
ncbi:TetR/AcrR family transcriptional regulator [Enterococcus sp. RIT-PI-f]|uniref:TetR/AcrR family transcriptional regulator n=1 Tax=Enterococcus sp. RIT-PI-f TaxID=1690244 RepID=UPI0006B8FB1D|nr:TetR/AcrR family transcriptional regulator [Enterococcus sp. RIT-PI-f]KPG71126.1 TetR family transcriptional regulator [Enterococcus sp. RIT-PI-f]